MLGQPLFPGESGIDQLVEIIKVLGTPTRDQIRTMNPNYMEHKFPQIKPHPFSKVCVFFVFEDFPNEQSLFWSQYQVFRKASPEAIDLISRLLEYTPTQRLSAIEAMCHPFFDELRDPNTKLPDSRGGQGLRDLPRLFDFSRHGGFISFRIQLRGAVFFFSFSFFFVLQKRANSSILQSSQLCLSSTSGWYRNMLALPYYPEV